MRDVPVYALVVGKNGPKFRETNPDVPFTEHGLAANPRNRMMRYSGATMDSFVDRIIDLQGLDRPVVNETGLTGKYDIKVEATMPLRMARDPQPDDLSFFTAIQDQLGLKLEDRKRPMEILVVDRMEKPAGN